jgi:hypothetical protein
MPRQYGQQETIPVVEIRPVHLTTQDSDLMPKRKDLDLLGPVTTPEQNQELEDTTEDEVEEGPEHKQRGCPLPTHAQAINLQVSQANPVSAPHKVRRFGEDGKKKAAVAVAHTLLCIAWAVMSNDSDYREDGADFYDRRVDPRQRAARHTAALRRLGFDVVLTPVDTDDPIPAAPPPREEPAA